MKRPLYGKILDANELRAMGADLMEFHVDVREMKQDSEGARIIMGMASTGSVDRVGDIIEPGAFRKTLKNFLKTNPLILAHHSALLGIGHALDAEVTDSGLSMAVRIGTGTNPNDPLEIMWNRISQRIYRALSIGYHILRREDILDNGRVMGWRIIELDLYEVSVVAIPANAEALFDIAKAVRNGTDLDYDLYGRGLWGIPPHLNIYDKKVMRVPGESLARIDVLTGGLAEKLAVAEG